MSQPNRQYYAVGMMNAQQFDQLCRLHVLNDAAEIDEIRRAVLQRP